MPSGRVALADAPVPALSGSSATSGLLLAQYERGAYGRSVANTDASVDLEPPLIEHDVVAEAEADIRQTFVATVVDDQDLDSVIFYYRYAGETSFSRYVMMQVSYSSTYIAQIPTDPNGTRAIEYYIQARDTSGNRTVRGYTFSPLVRNIVLPPAEEPVIQAQADASADAAAREGAGISRVVYIVGGVLILGLIASAASSSGGSGGGGCSDDGCRLSLTIDQPF
ncbi:hypothetical protein [Granulosicoccus sp. 3-233]|uniref:hypothetical protein n=1 Tax=Granulosicoccus sp. 3-233 TaxID=3417969 RepID=UPI003D358B58